MESRPPLKQGAERYRGVTEKSKALLFLLREAPYITLADAKRFFYPKHKTLSYAREMIRVLVRNELLGRYRMGDGLFIYYLTDTGRRIAEFYLEDRPKFDSDTKSFYYTQKPTKDSEAADLFIFPSRNLEFYPFAPHFLYAHPFLHTRSLMELSVQFRHCFRFLHVLWLDQIKAKKNTLNLSCHPDLLLCNSLKEETGRVYIEFENSRIRDIGLLEKIQHLTSHAADWYLFLASSEDLLQNLGRLVRKILSGDVKLNRQTVYFNPKAHSALVHKVLFGLWTPSFRKDGVIQPLKEVELFRYDHECFDAQVWRVGRIPTEARTPETPPAQLQTIGYPARRPGNRKWILGDILNPYAESFRTALDAAMS